MPETVSHFPRNVLNQYTMLSQCIIPYIFVENEFVRLPLLMKCHPLSVTFTESAQVEKPAATVTSQSSSSGSGSLNPSSGPPGSSASTVPVSPVLQSPAPPLLQDPTLLRQLLPALQTALQLNNASVDMAKINEGRRNADVVVHTVYTFNW